MSHGGPSTLAKRSGFLRWLILFSGGGAWLCGVMGVLVHEAHEGELWNQGLLHVVNCGFFATYAGLQLLLGHAHEGHFAEVNGWLIAGRMLAIVFIVDMALEAYFVIFRNEWQLRRAQSSRRRGHVLVCGLGDLGLRMALEARRKGKVVVAVENHGQAENVERARSHGVLVVEGDAKTPALLKRVHAQQAEVVLATCREDHTNVAIAVAVGGLVAAGPARNQPLLCRLLIADAELRDLLVDRSNFSFDGAGTPSNYRVNCNDLDFHQTAARQALARHELDFAPLRKGDLTQVHLVVAGFQAMGRSLALHAARIGHFANRVEPGIKLRITVVDVEGEKLLEDLKQRQPQLERICDLAARSADPASVDFVDTLCALGSEGSGPQPLVTYAVCFEKDGAADGGLNFRIGAALARKTKNCTAQTLVYTGNQDGFAALLRREINASDLNPRLYPFGIANEVFNWDTLLHESQDQVARALHDDFRKQRRQANVPDTDNPAWEQLEESLLASNRDAADHIPIKARALGYYVGPLQNAQPIERFDASQVELLARMEHFRWCARRWLSGWKLAATKDPIRKTNPCLVPFEELPDQEQRKDPEQIEAIIRALKQNGQGIFR